MSKLINLKKPQNGNKTTKEVSVTEGSWERGRFSKRGCLSRDLIFCDEEPVTREDNSGCGVEW